MTVLSSSTQGHEDPGLHSHPGEDSGLHLNMNSLNHGDLEAVNASHAVASSPTRNVVPSSQFVDDATRFSRSNIENQGFLQSPFETFQLQHTLSSNLSEKSEARIREDSLAPAPSILKTEADSQNEQSLNSRGHLNQEPQAPQFTGPSRTQSAAELADVERQQTRSVPIRKFKGIMRKRYFDGASPPKRGWCLTIFGTILSLVAIVIALAVVYSIHGHGTEATSISVTVTNYPPTQVSPVSGSSLGARDIIFGTYFSTSTSDKPQTKIVWDGGNGKLCVRTKLGTTWLDNIHCVTGANQLTGTPLTLVDWLGGPTIAFITKDHLLSSINYVPGNDTWILSNLIESKISTHPSSRLTSITWLNGTSIWIYYQGTDEQIHEWGLDDYRDESWRDGSVGPLGKALVGSSIGVARWTHGSDEVEEVFFQATNGAIHGRRYANSVWDTELYNVAGTETGVNAGASLAATGIMQANNQSSVLLTYIASSGFLTVQTRGTADNITDFGSFSKPAQVIQGDGSNTPGLATDGASGSPTIYLLKSQKVLALTGDVTASNFTTTDITS